MSEKKDYFDYVENVLGIKSILLNPTSVQESVKTPLLICVENYLNYTPEEKDLLAKMIGALKIDLQKIKVMPLDESVKCPSDFSVYFLEKLDQITANENTVTTYSPRILLKNAEFKKNAWNDLQKVITYFKQSN